MSLAKLLTRRAAIAAPVLAVLGLHEDVEADACTQKCKKRKTKEQKQRCLKQCKKRAARLPRYANVNGAGPGLSASFGLAGGRYLISATHADAEGTNFIVHLWGPKGYEGYIFNELEFDPGTYPYQVVEEVPYDGTYFFEVQYAGGPWSISMGPV